MEGRGSGDAEKGDVGAVEKCMEAKNGKGLEKTTFRDVWNAFVWHGGSVYDAWLNAVAAQVLLSVFSFLNKNSPSSWFGFLVVGRLF